MNDEKIYLMQLFQGWDGYQASLVRSIANLTPAQLAWSPAANLRTAGQIATHISTGRIGWFERMGAPGSADLAAQWSSLAAEGAFGDHPADLVRWLEDSWQMVENTLKTWTVTDLAKTYRKPYQGQVYTVSYQWTIWRIMAHDLHHGGELAVTLGMQGVPLPELGDLGGHLTVPPLAEGG